MVGQVRMIDFAHVFPLGAEEPSGDDAYAVGLDNLMTVLRGISEGLATDRYLVLVSCLHTLLPWPNARLWTCLPTL